jgi:hypothetical protein
MAWPVGGGTESRQHRSSTKHPTTASCNSNPRFCHSAPWDVMSDDGFFSSFSSHGQQLSPGCRETPSSSDSGASTIGKSASIWHVFPSACQPPRRLHID